MPELLAPAGNREKLEAAIRFGADAVYFSGQVFGMRASAANFSSEELISAVKYAHEHGVLAYITVNTMPRESEYEILKSYFKNVISVAKPDALIVADIGVLTLARELLPGIALHLSTQANALSSAACRAWASLGVKRIVLARELSLAEIKTIRQNLPKEIELEAFIHGSMCISYSGRCLLSNFFTSRDANRGQCTQPCRWSYSLHSGDLFLKEEKRPDIPIPMEEHGGETFFMSSRDTCMIDHMDELMTSGINSFKIEGRMKSAYYTAVTTNTYRMAIDAWKKGESTPNPAWRRELESVSHREYATGYYFGDAQKDANVTMESGYRKEKAFLAIVEAYDPKTGLALCRQKNKFSLGDSLEALTPGFVGQGFIAEALFDGEMHPISSVPHPGMQFYLLCPFALHSGDILRAGE